MLFFKVMKNIYFLHKRIFLKPHIIHKFKVHYVSCHNVSLLPAETFRTYE